MYKKTPQILPSNSLKGAVICFYRLFDESTFSNILCTLQHLIMECTKLNWLCKHIKMVRNTQAAIVVLKWVKHSFYLWVLLREILKKSLVEIIWVDKTKLDESFPNQHFKIHRYQFPPFRRNWINMGMGRSFLLKECLPVFCIGINTHGDKKWKIM